ncbi:glycosyltransferase family 2 protein [Vibrio sp. FNV 38]|nr:glycosyltransferase family 2 protein [Vibrio sp. FNV 38]
MKVNICICTYRRPSLYETLTSLEAMVIPSGIELSIIIADNDETPTGLPLVETFVNTSHLDIRYLHAPKQNISIARNACLDACDGEWIGFIDDDETVDINWLNAMTSAIKHNQHDIFLGPVEATYNNKVSARWMLDGAFHDTKPTFRAGEICSGYTCNVLIRYTDTKVKSLRFDQRFGRTGGEDTFLFEKLKRYGLSMTYIEDAVVFEPVPKERSSLTWLVKRRFRFGQTHARVILENRDNIKVRIQLVTLASFKALFCYVVALLSAFHPIKWRKWTIRGALHIGVLSRLIKNKDIELYGHA